MTLKNTSSARQILFEGYTSKQILAFSLDDLQSFICFGESFIFKVGSATILGEFRLTPKKLIVELAHIEGGGEGILSSLWLLLERYAKKQNLSQIEWVVHALTCSKPNPKLKRILEKRGFQVKDLPEIGQAYYFLDQLF